MAQSQSLPTYALTTVFTPPPSCTASWTYEAAFYNSVSGGLLIQNALGSDIDSDCFPTNFGDSGRGAGAEIYSPGYCPVGYTSPGAFQAGGTTTGYCCPSGFAYSTTLTTVNFFANTVIFAGCVSIYPKSNGPTTVRARANDSDLATTAIGGPLTMWGQPVVVEWQQKDLSLFSISSTTSSTSSASSSASPSSSPTANQAASTSSAPSPSPTTNSGLSTGAKAGIGVGVAILALLVLGVAIFFFTRRQRRAAQNRTSESQGIPEGPRNDYQKSELHGDHVVHDNLSTRASHKQGPVNELEA